MAVYEVDTESNVAIRTESRYMLYPVIVDPPSEVGADQVNETVADVEPVRVGVSGAVGDVYGDAVDSAESVEPESL